MYFAVEIYMFEAISHHLSYHLFAECTIGSIRKPLPKIEQRWKVLNRFAHVSEDRIKERKELKYIGRCRAAITGINGVGKFLAHLLKMYPTGLTDLRLCN